jgi:MFS family permease
MTGADGFLAECRAGGGRIIVAALVGVGLGLSALPFYTLGVFAQPLSQAFHWPRALVQSGIIFSMLGTVCVAGLAGWLIDRIGVRRVALTSQLGLAAGFCLLAAQNGSPTLWHASWFLLAVLGIGTTPLTWSRGIAEWFVQARGHGARHCARRHRRHGVRGAAADRDADRVAGVADRLSRDRRGDRADRHAHGLVPLPR